MSEDPESEMILEICPACGQEMDVTQFEPFAIVECPCGEESRVKRVFGNYRLERRYAVGGMSVVFVAWDTTLDREVAVKILNEEYSIDGVRVEQFENEARLTAAVHNPHVVQIYTVGKAYGRFYLVMELLEGRSFEIIMNERGAIPEAEVLEIGRQVLDGLNAANQAGVIHRDVKPGNILIDSAGLVKLIDFGLALITKGGKAQAEEIWATPYYVPPEVLERKEEDFRSDLYALGATLYHALTGHPPFDSTTTRTKYLKEKKKTMPKLQKVASWLKPSTCNAIDRMMAYDPKNRAGSYREAQAMIDLALAEVSASAVPIHGAARAKRRGKRKYTALLQGGALLLTLGALAFVGHKIFRKKTEEPSPQLTTNTAPSLITPVSNSEQKDHGKTEFLTRTWEEGRAAISQREYELAATQFKKISQDKSIPEPTRSWAELEGILAKLLGGMSGEARTDASKMHRRLKETQDLNEISTGLKVVAARIAQIPPVSEEQFPNNPSNVVEWMSSLALTLKNWEQGLLQESRSRLEQIRAADLGGEYEWFSVYRNVINGYLHDAAILSDLTALPVPSSEVEAHEQLLDFNSRLGKLKTVGRAKFSVRSRQAYLARMRKGFQIRPGDAGVIPWIELKETLLELCQQKKFAEARTLLSENEKSGPVNARWAYEYLTQNARAFMMDLKGQKNKKIELKESGALVEVLRIDSDHLIVREENEPLPWSDFDTLALIKVHDALRSQTENPKALEMRTHGIAFTLLNGLKAIAEFEAEQFAEENQEFAKDWKRVLIGLSE